MSTQAAGLAVLRSGVRKSGSTVEEVLVSRAKSGNSTACGELYERNRARLIRCTFRILRNRQDAEDVVQLAFQRALTNLHRFREDSTFSTWITRIAMNEALMLLRRRKVAAPLPEGNTDVETPFALELADSRPTPEQALAETELQAAVAYAISRLRKNLRTAVVLREMQGLTSAETARELGLTVSAVKARIFQARRHLRRHLHRVGITRETSTKAQCPPVAMDESDL